MSTFFSATAGSAGRSSTAGFLNRLLGRNVKIAEHVSYDDMRDVYIAGISPSEARRMTR